MLEPSVILIIYFVILDFGCVKSLQFTNSFFNYNIIAECMHSCSQIYGVGIFYGDALITMVLTVFQF